MHCLQLLMSFFAVALAQFLHAWQHAGRYASKPTITVLRADTASGEPLLTKAQPGICVSKKDPYKQ